MNIMELTLPAYTNRSSKIIGKYELINWYRAKIITVMDIKASPFREFIVS